MALSAPRLTIYALLSSVEEDLRELVLRLGSDLADEEILTSELYASATRRYMQENGRLDDPKGLRDLLPYVDLGDLIQALARHKASLNKNIRNHITPLVPELELLVPVRKRIAHVRPFRYDDVARVTAFTDRVSAGQANLWPSVTETVAKLSRDPTFVFDIPPPPYEETPNTAFHNLPLPEFDDTGFLGRVSEIAGVLALCKGPWPVISIVGEGGLGKTALALRCAYDLLDDTASPFDAVIWSTSKTTRLDSTQIVEIDGAIRDSLGLFGEIATVLGVPGSGSARKPLDEILSYLETFRVLLILDNLETVLDANVRKFLSQLPAGSKVLITSRIGIGEFEYRVALRPLETGDASRLLRTVAKLSGAHVIGTMPEDTLRYFCERMQNNPLFIKWFVSAVQAGVAPEAVLAEPATFLDFCMSNVYEYLTSPARDLLKVLMASPDELSLPELLYFSAGQPHETQAAVQELLATNMLKMNSAATEHRGLVETRYLLTELARLYLTRHHPLTIEEDRHLERSRRRLDEETRRVSHRIAGDRYDTRTIVPRSKSDLLVVKPLLEALRFADKGDFERALQEVQAAKVPAPDYYECFRVEAQVHAAAHNVAVADAHFRTALDQASDSAPLLYFYAQFQRTARRNPDAALELLALAIELEPGQPRLLMEAARCNLDLLAFSQARAAIDELLLSRGSLPIANEVWRLSAEYYVARANFAAATADTVGAIGALEGLRRDVETAPYSAVDALKRLLPGAIGAAWCCVTEGDEGTRVRAEEFLGWVALQKGVRLPYAVSLSEERIYGKVKFIDPQREFGFIDGAQYGDVYFHRAGMRNHSDFDLLKRETPVSFMLAASERGRRAREVEIG